MNKIGYWTLTIVTIALLVGGFLYYRQMTNSNISSTPNTPYVNPYSYPDTTPINQNTYSLSTFNGSTMYVKDFTKDSATKKSTSNSGYYYLGYHYDEGLNDPTASENPPYVIEYIEETQHFSVSLLQEPLKDTRKKAEQYLLSKLGVAQGQLCKLKYSVSVPARVNADYAATNLGFSFCPGAETLP